MRAAPGRRPRTRAPLVLTVLAWLAAGAAGAETRQDFDRPGAGTPYAPGLHCEPPQAAAQAGGPFGGFLRLAHTHHPNCNSIAFNRSDTGAFGYIVATFWFRIANDAVPREQRADGLGFALLNTSLYGTTGAVASDGPPFTAEEPQFRRSLGIGFDVHRADPLPDGVTREDEPSDNHVSIHFDGRVVTVFRLKKDELDLAGGGWIHAAIHVRSATEHPEVRIVLTPLTPAGALQPPAFDGRAAVPGLVPYPARAYFAARSGGLEADHDLDSVRVAFSNLPSPTTYASFDAPGSGFALARDCGEAPARQQAGGWSGDFLRLAHAAAPSCNSIAFERTSPGLYPTVMAEFDLRMKPANGRADGFGFALLNTAVYGSHGAVAPGVAEEPNFTKSLGVGFDIHKADLPPDVPPAHEPSDNHLSIHWDGRLVAAFPVARDSLDLASPGGKAFHVSVLVKHGAGFADVVVTLAPLPAGAQVIRSLRVAGVAPYESRAYFAARSGFESAEHDLDSVAVSWRGAVEPRTYGAWSPVASWPAVPIHMHLLPTGKVLFWDRHGDAGHPAHWDGRPQLWDPATGRFEHAMEPGYDVFCGGHSFLGDGQLLVAGGHILDHVGLELASSYDAFTGEWEPLPSMSDGRWYPTSTTLGGGGALVSSGEITTDEHQQGRPLPNGAVVNDLPEVWEPESHAWRPLTCARRALPLYPWMFQAPDGRVFHAGPQPEAAFLDVSGCGAWSEGGIASHAGARAEGSAVIADGKVLIVGGGSPPTNRAEIVDLDAPVPAWREVEPMAYARRFLTATLLPDGSTLVTGGTTAENTTAGAVYVPEVWNPKAGAWSPLAAMQVPRLYHSGSLLLPDARVLVAGGGHPESGDQGIDHDNAQLYSPPYLFRGPRPTIGAAPAQAARGATIVVQTPQAAAIAGVSLVRLGSVTHTFDQDQRFVSLRFAATAGALEVTLPSDPNRCPPGYYMLFILNGSGVPSVAKMLRVGGAPAS